MSNRPTSVNIIGWFLIVTALISLVSSYINMDNPITKELMAKSGMSVPLQYGVMYLGLAVAFISGIAIRQGHKWARTLYLGWSVFGLVVALFTSPVKIMLVPGVLMLAVIAYFLFRPQANAYFSQRLAANDA